MRPKQPTPQSQGNFAAMREASRRYGEFSRVSRMLMRDALSFAALIAWYALLVAAGLFLALVLLPPVPGTA